MQEDKLLSQGEKKDTITHFVPEIYLVKEQIWFSLCLCIFVILK